MKRESVESGKDDEIVEGVRKALEARGILPKSISPEIKTQSGTQAQQAAEWLLRFVQTRMPPERDAGSITNELQGLLEGSRLSELPEDVEFGTREGNLPAPMLYRLAEYLLQRSNTITELEQMILEDARTAFPQFEKPVLEKIAFRLLEKMQNGERLSGHEDDLLTEASILLPEKTTAITEVLSNPKNAEYLRNAIKEKNIEGINIHKLLSIPISQVMVIFSDNSDFQEYCKLLNKIYKEVDFSSGPHRLQASRFENLSPEEQRQKIIEDTESSGTRKRSENDIRLLTAFLSRDLTPAVRDEMQKRLGKIPFNRLLTNFRAGECRIRNSEAETQREVVRSIISRAPSGEAWGRAGESHGLTPELQDIFHEVRRDEAVMQGLRDKYADLYSGATLEHKDQRGKTAMTKVARAVFVEHETRQNDEMNKLLYRSVEAEKRRIEELERVYESQKTEFSKVIADENPDIDPNTDDPKQQEYREWRRNSLAETHPRILLEGSRKICEFISGTSDELDYVRKSLAHAEKKDSELVLTFIQEILEKLNEMKTEAQNDPFMAARDFAKKWGISENTAEAILMNPPAIRQLIDLRNLEEGGFVAQLAKKSKTREIKSYFAEKIAHDGFFQAFIASPDIRLAVLQFSLDSAEEFFDDVEQKILTARKNAEVSTDQISQQVDDVKKRIEALGVDSELVKKAEAAVKIISDQAAHLAWRLDHDSSISIEDVQDTDDKKIRQEERQRLADRILELKAEEAKLKELVDLGAELQIDPESLRLKGRREAKRTLTRLGRLLHEFEERQSKGEDIRAGMGSILRDLEEGLAQHAASEANKPELRLDDFSSQRLNEWVSDNSGKMREFALWVIGSDVLDPQKLIQFKDLKNPNGVNILTPIADDKWNDKKSLAQYEPLKEGFLIKVPRSVFEAIEKGDLEKLTNLSKFIRHESLHAIDDSTDHQLSKDFFQLVKSHYPNENELDALLEEFQTARGKVVDRATLIEELFVSYFSSEDLPELNAVISRIMTRVPQAEIDVFRETQLREAADQFVENGIKTGFWKRLTGEGKRDLAYAGPAEPSELDPAEVNATKIFSFEEERRKLDELLGGLKASKVKVRGKDQYIQTVESELDSYHDVLHREVLSDDLFTVMIKDINAWKDQVSLTLGRIAAYDKEDTNYFKNLYKNTYYLKIDDLKHYWSKFLSWYKRRYAVQQKRRIGATGKAIFQKIPFLSSLSTEFEVDENQSVAEEVEVYKKGVKELDNWQIMDRIDHPANKEALKAYLFVLAENGAIDWNDRRIWKGIEKTTDGAVRIKPSDAINVEVLKRKLQDAFGMLYDEDFFSTVDRQSINTFESNKKKYEPEAKSNDSRLSMVIEEMISERSHGEKIRPERFEAYIDFCVSGGKVTPEEIFWYIFQGVRLGLLNWDRLNAIKNVWSNELPFVVWYTKKKPSMEYMMYIAQKFKPTPEGKMPREFMDWLQTEVISHPEVLDRIIKAFSDGRKHDPGWAQLTVSIGNFGTAKKIMDGRLSNPPVPDNGLTNILSGQLLRFTALARNREKINKGEMKKMLGTHIEYVTTYNALAKERTTIKDMKSISTDALGQEVGTQGNYKKGGNKTGYEFIAANETILKAADEKLFKLIFETGGKIGDNLPAIQNHIINNYSNLDANIKPPDTEEGVLRSIGEYMKALLNAPNGKGDEAMERILNASLEQYKRDHDGETNLGTYQLREGEFSYHPQYPKEDRGMWGGK